MKPDLERLDRLALSVADGVAVDWEAAGRDASDEEERGVVLNLRSLESLASAVRGRRSPPSSWQGLRLREPLGRGAFGDVFMAWDAKLQREVALKLVPLAHEELSAVALEEGRLLARVRHPHVVSVYGADVAFGFAGLWMERIQGRTLATIVGESGPLRFWDLALVALDVTRALAAVHAAGVLHCDVKPSNVMREQGGRTVLMDFGIGRRAGATGALGAGTPAFMAPETLRGEPASVRSDVYMVGALLYALGTGRPPDGWSTAEDMATAFRAALDGQKRSTSGRIVLAASIAALAIGGVAVALRMQPAASHREASAPRSVAPAVPSSLAVRASPAAAAVTPRAGASGDPFVPPVGSTVP